MARSRSKRGKAIFRSLRNGARREEGSVAVIAALAMVVFLGFTALAVDMGAMYYAKTNLQNIADAAALAGAQELPNANEASDTAVQYALRNGMSETDILVTTPYSGDSSLIEVVCTQIKPYLFARVLGFEDQVITTRAVAKKDSLGGAFDYTLFSGSSSDMLKINGSNLYVQGNAHSNQKFRINGSQQTITGAAEAVSSFAVNGSNITIGSIWAASISTNGSNLNIGQQVECPAPWIDMPDFSDAVQAEAEAAGQYYENSMTFSGSYFSVDGSIYVDGDATVNGSHFQGKGCILATGDLRFNGSNLTNDSGDAVCFYSANGDITINGSCSGLCGIVYAPNGTITFNGSNQTIHGRVIGNKIRINGSNFAVIGGSDELLCIPNGGVRLVE